MKSLEATVDTIGGPTGRCMDGNPSKYRIWAIGHTKNAPFGPFLKSREKCVQSSFYVLQMLALVESFILIKQWLE